MAGEEAVLAVNRARGRAWTMPSLKISSSRAVAEPATSSSHMMRLRSSSEIAEASGSDVEAMMGNGEVSTGNEEASTGNGKASTSSNRVNAVALRAASLWRRGGGGRGRGFGRSRGGGGLPRPGHREYDRHTEGYVIISKCLVSFFWWRFSVFFFTVHFQFELCTGGIWRLRPPI